MSFLCLFDKIFDSIDYTEFDFTSFEQGAKWQQQNSYSEEEVIQLVSDWTDYRMSEDAKSKVTFKKYLEQFKKK